MIKGNRVIVLTVVFLAVGLVATNCSATRKDFKKAPETHSSTDANYIEKYKKTARTYKIGRPYKILGQTFYPGHDPSYDEVGIASWYGPNVGVLTANGELFDQDEIAAAHPTLPLPSIVEVTNLENGRVVKVKVNDRGPFKHNRVIDLTRGAAEKIGMIDKGIAKVRVRFLKDETLDYLVYDH